MINKICSVLSCCYVFTSLVYIAFIAKLNKTEHFCGFFYLKIWLTFASRFQIICADFFFTNLTKGLIFAKIKPSKLFNQFFLLQHSRFLSTFIWPQIFLGILDFIYTSVSRLIKFKIKCLNAECYSEYHLCWNEIERRNYFIQGSSTGFSFK